MQFRILLKSKTFWTGLAAIAYGLYTLSVGDAPAGVQEIIIGLTAIFLRDGIAKLGK